MLSIVVCIMSLIMYNLRRKEERLDSWPRWWRTGNVSASILQEGNFKISYEN